MVWRPEWSVRLVEVAGSGTTVEQAATNRLIERAERAATVIDIAAALDLALLAALSDAVTPIVDQLSNRAAGDPDIAHLMAALSPLAQAQRYGDVRATDLRSLATVFDGLVVRVLAGLVPACASLDDEAAAAMIEHISSTHQALTLASESGATLVDVEAALEALAGLGLQVPDAQAEEADAAGGTEADEATIPLPEAERPGRRRKQPRGA